MLEGVDYSHRAPDVGALKEGFGFVCRYVSTPGNPKNLTHDEYLELRAHGLEVVVVFETSAQRALDGMYAGYTDAKAALVQLGLMGIISISQGGPVYFAVDFDARPDQQAAINAYLAGAAKVLGKDRVGVYGGYWVVKRALDAGACKYAWQTYAWSGGHWDPRAHIRQYQNGVHLAGMEVDRDRSMCPDYGQTPRYVPPKPKAPYPQDARFWTWLRWRLGEGEFVGHGCDRKVRPNVPALIPPTWWLAAGVFLARRK